MTDGTSFEYGAEDREPSFLKGIDLGDENGNVATFDAEELLDTVLWHVVDEVWGGQNWRKLAKNGYMLNFPRAKTINNTETTVRLVVSRKIDDDDSSGNQVYYDELSIFATEKPEGDERELIIRRAIEQGGPLFDSKEEDLGDLVVFRGVEYFFDSCGEVIIQPFQIIEDGGGSLLWDSNCESELDDDTVREGIDDGEEIENDVDSDSVQPPDPIFEHDIEFLQKALGVLNINKKTMKKLANIKKRKLS